jgi:uncharacterized membrane protein
VRHRQAIALLALVGFFIALYLWLHAIGVIGVLRCGTGNCETVQASAYARLGGVPVAFFGVVGYLALLVVALVGLQPSFLDRRGPSILLFVLATGGLLFTGYLTYLEAFVIHAWCRWCLASAAIIAVIWVVAVAGVRPSDRATVRQL